MRAETLKKLTDELHGLKSRKMDAISVEYGKIQLQMNYKYSSRDRREAAECDSLAKALDKAIQAYYKARIEALEQAIRDEVAL